MSDDDPAEYGRRLAEQSAAKLDLTSVAQSAAAIALFCDIYQLLVEKQVLTQGDAVSRLEKVSNAIMASDTGTSRAHAVALVDIVRNAIAGETERKPS
jgi:hypothetical protein